MSSEGRARLERYTPINNINPQGTAKNLMDMTFIELDRLYENQEILAKALDPTSTSGDTLTKLSFLVGKSRASAVAAADYTSTNFVFYIDRKLSWSAKQLIERNYTTQEITVLESGGYITRDSNNEVYGLVIKAGTAVSTNANGIAYTTIEDVVLAGTTDAYVGVVASSVGVGGNVASNQLIVHNLYQIAELRKIARYIKCTNKFPIRTGKSSTTDEELRYDISTANLEKTGNDLSIRKTALQTPGVRDILFESHKFGAGTVNLIVDGVSPLISDGLIAAVKQRVKNVSTSGDIIFVNRPEYVGVEINFNIRVNPGTTDPLVIRNNARNSIIQYINDLEIGGEIIWNEIIEKVQVLDGVIDFIPNYFKIGKYDILNKINKEQTLLRFANQKAAYNVKYYTDSGLITACIA